LEEAGEKITVEGAEGMKRIIVIGTVFILVAVIGYSGYRLGELEQINQREREVRNWLMQYKPEVRTSGSADFLDLPDIIEFRTSAPMINQSIADLQAVRPAVTGWLTVPGTKVDYPFAQGGDNEAYLKTDLNQARTQAGTIFMDYRNSGDFSDFNTIIYGHNMKNGSMFGSLRYFAAKDFFDLNRTGTIFLHDRTYQIDIMAFAVIDPYDEFIYNPMISTYADKSGFLAHIKSIARYYRDVGVTADDHIVTLSTCYYGYNDVRTVLIGKLAEI
jgi:SrtB family sortase